VNFPSLQDVEKADREQLCRWWRFLPLVGNNSELMVMNAIGARLKVLGSFTPEISKKIGWRTE